MDIVGAAYAKFGLDISNLETNFTKAKTLLGELRALSGTAIVSKVQAQASGGSGSSGGGGSSGQAAQQSGNAAASAATGWDALAKSEVRALNAMRDYQGVLDKLDDVEKNHALTVQQSNEVLAVRSKAERDLSAEMTRNVQASAKALTSVKSYDQALLTLNTRLGQITKGTAEYRGVQAQIFAVESQRRTSIAQLTDAEVKAQLAVKNHAGALQALQKELTTVIGGSKRHFDLLTQINNVQGKQAKANAPNTNSNPAANAAQAQAKAQRQLEVQLTRTAQIQAAAAASSGNYGDALNKLSTALALVTKYSSSHATLMSQYRTTAAQSERQTRATADAQARAAKNAGDFAGALRILNAELARATPGSQRYHDVAARIATASRQQTSALNIAAGAVQKMLVPLATGALTAISFGRAIEFVAESFTLLGALEAQSAQVSALVNNVERGSRIFQDAARFGREFGFSQREMGEAAADGAILLQKSNVQANEAFEILARLRTRAPSQPFSAAVRSIGELQAGQLQSIQRVFNIPAVFAQRMRDEIESGVDPLIALSRVLDQLGQTSEALEARLTGSQGATIRYTQAQEELGLQMAELIQGPATRFLGFLASGVAGINMMTQAQNNASDAGVTWGQWLEKIPQAANQAFAANARMAAQSADETGLGKPYQYLYTVLNSGAAFFATFGQASVLATAEATDGAAKAAAAQADYNKIIAETSPALKAIATGNPLNEQIQLADDLNSRMNVLVASMQQGDITGVQLANRIKALRGNVDAPPDPSGIIASIDKLGLKGEDRLAALQGELASITAAMGKPENAAVLDDLIADAHVVALELGKVQAMSPIEIDAIMRVKQIGDVTSAFNALISGGKSLQADLDQMDADRNTRRERYRVEDSQRETRYLVGYENAFNAHKEAREKAETALSKELGKISKDNGEELLDIEIAYGRERRNAAEEYGLQIANAQRSYNQSTARANRDFAQQMERSQRDYSQGQQRSERDYAQSIARGNRDFARSEQRTLEDHLRTQADLRRNAAKEETRAIADHLRDLQRMQRDYDIERTRDFEDYEIERRRLLAEGKIYEAQLMGERFNRERRRADEDFSRERSDAGDNFGSGKQDRATQLAEQLAENQANFDRQRQQRIDDFKLQQADAAAAHAQQKADAAAAFAQSQADARAAFAQQQADAKIAYEQQLADMATAYARQQAKAAEANALQVEEAKKAGQKRIDDAKEKAAEETITRNDAYDKQLKALVKAHEDEGKANRTARIADALDFTARRKERIAEFDALYKEQVQIVADANAAMLKDVMLARGGMESEERAVVLSLEKAYKDYARIFNDQVKLSKTKGLEAGLGWAEGLAKGILLDVDRRMEETMGPYADSMLPKSPIKRGPLKDHERAAFRAGTMYANAFREGIAAGMPGINAPLLAIKQSLAQDYSHGSVPGGRYNDPVYRTTPRDVTRMDQPDRTSPVRPIINITVPVGFEVDGRTIGEIVAPHVAGSFLEAADVAISVVQAKQTIALQQPSFRSDL